MEQETPNRTGIVIVASIVGITFLASQWQGWSASESGGACLVALLVLRLMLNLLNNPSTFAFIHLAVLFGSLCPLYWNSPLAAVVSVLLVAVFLFLSIFIRVEN